MAALSLAHTEIVDELVRLFDQAMAGTDSRARHRVAERLAGLVEADAKRLVLLDEILDVVLDPGLDDAAVGRAVRGSGDERLTLVDRVSEEIGQGSNGEELLCLLLALAAARA